MEKGLEENPKRDFTSMTNVEKQDILINFGYGTKEEKKKILFDHPDKKVFMDLTSFNPEEFYSNFPQLHGCFSALFCNDNKKIEVHLRHENQLFLTEMKNLGFTAITTTLISSGFIFPRTIALIINEAYFALEEGIASKEDINRAMKFGVNYPKGPFEWAHGREKVVVSILNELLNSTQDQRYNICKLLLKEA
jgi:3-hydroxybutyryl-CoA dehydrogenase